MADHPDANQYQRNWTVQAKVLGWDSIDGTNCILVQNTVTCDPTSNLTTEFRIWISPQHSYLPLRYESRPSSVVCKLPLNRGEVTKLKQVKEGIWVPETWKKTQFLLEDLQQGKFTEKSVFQGTLKKLDLSPNYDASHFKKFEYTTGSVYYEVNSNGKIVRGGEIRRDRTGFLASSGIRYSLLALVIIIVLFIAFAYRHRFVS